MEKTRKFIEITYKFYKIGKFFNSKSSTYIKNHPFVIPEEKKENGSYGVNFHGTFVNRGEEVLVDISTFIRP